MSILQEVKNYVKFYYYRSRGSRLMKNYSRAVTALSHSYNMHEAEKLCPIIKNYRIKAKECMWKARAAQTQIRMAGLFD